VAAWTNGTAFCCPAHSPPARGNIIEVIESHQAHCCPAWHSRFRPAIDIQWPWIALAPSRASVPTWSATCSSACFSSCWWSSRFCATCARPLIPKRGGSDFSLVGTFAAMLLARV